MYIKVFDAQGESKGYLNLDRIDMFWTGAPLNDVLTEFHVRQGSSTKTFYISNGQNDRLNDRLARYHIN